MSRTPKTVRAFTPDTRVMWREGCKPVAFPHTHGTVFTSTARMTFVSWDGAGIVPVATVALVKAV